MRGSPAQVMILFSFPQSSHCGGFAHGKFNPRQSGGTQAGNNSDLDWGTTQGHCGQVGQREQNHLAGNI